MVNKILSAGITLAFMAVVRPDEGVSLVGIAFVSVLMYETLVYCIKYVRKMHRKERYIESTRISKQDIQRWASQWFDPYEEVV